MIEFQGEKIGTQAYGTGEDEVLIPNPTRDAKRLMLYVMRKHEPIEYFNMSGGRENVWIESMDYMLTQGFLRLNIVRPDDDKTHKD